MQRHGAARDIFQTERAVNLFLLYYSNGRKARRPRQREKPGGVGQSNFIAIQVLTIFHKYSILSIKDKSNRHSQSI